MIMMNNKLMCMDASFKITNWSSPCMWIYVFRFVFCSSYSLFHKSVVQLKSFDNIFSDLDDTPNVLSFRSFHSHKLIFFAIINWSSCFEPKWWTMTKTHTCLIILSLLHHWFFWPMINTWEEAQVLLIENYVSFCFLFLLKKGVRCTLYYW